MTHDHLPLTGRTIAVTAERRSEQQVELLEKRGAAVLHVPTMHTIDVSADPLLRQRTVELIEEPPAWTVATTGFGARLWFEAVDGWGLGEQLQGALRRSRVIARGAKAQSVCRQRGLDVEWTAPDESMAAVVDWLGQQPGIDEARVAVQLFDADDHPSTTQLRSLAATVVEVPVYRWRLPDDTDAVTFTSQPAVRFLLEVADTAGLADAVVEAFNDGAVLPVCVGPVCAEAGADAGITTMVWPEPFRLAPMVRLVEESLTRDEGTRVRSGP